jgi:hypothetical protein
MDRRRVCIGASGSIAAVKLPEIVAKLVAADVFVDVILTKSAERLLAVDYKGGIPMVQLEQICTQRDALEVKRVQVRTHGLFNGVPILCWVLGMA